MLQGPRVPPSGRTVDLTQTLEGVRASLTWGSRSDREPEGPPVEPLRPSVYLKTPSAFSSAIRIAAPTTAITQAIAGPPPIPS